MSSELTYANAYQKEELIEQCMYSTLFAGKKGDARQAVLVRHWPTAQAATSEEQARIQAEVAALRAVRHPYLLPVLEVALTEQGIFLMSIRTPGGVLSTRLARRFAQPLPLDEALLLITRIGQALAVLHQQGIVHGNLSPHAIFFDISEQAYLGECRLPGILACIPDYQPALDEGTPQWWYMAPEQFSGASNASTDQYALGCLAYQLLSGRVPFAGSVRATLCQKHLQEQPRALSEHNSAVPAHLEEVVLKAIAKEPAERYPDVQAFLDALCQPQREAIAEQETGNQPVLETGWSGSLPALQDRQAASQTPEVRGNQRQGYALLSSRWKGKWALTGIACIVLLAVFLSGRSLFFASTHSRQTAGRPTANASLPTAGLTQASGQTTVGLQQSPTAVGVPSPLPTTIPSPLPTATPSPAAQAVVPLLDCVMQAGGMLIAEFGYQNPNAFAVLIPQGGQNTLTPASANGSQPASFAPGLHHRVFQVPFSKHGTATWTLDGARVVAKGSSPQC
jgi:serine/threonine protein kinase